MTTGQGVPPSLDGFTFLSWLGGGGFADVFLYQQHLPERRVAVKVLREVVDDSDARTSFYAETNLMAKVSTHPNIVTIYGAMIATDRRPCLVMEYYSLPPFSQRLQNGSLAVHEALEVGIKIASAVETAHRNNVVHRDIKPSNILTSEFGEPGLTDFGISAVHTETSTDESLGFSPPYAPPEILSDESPGNALSDVYSLAATIWALLAGHSPFELADRRLSRSEVIARGLNQPVPQLPRTDVPRSFELALQHALSKDPQRRPTSALSFARTLQSVEQELGYRPTALNLLRDAVVAVPVIDTTGLQGDKTRIGRGKVVQPDGPTLARPSVGRATPGGLIDRAPAAGSDIAAVGPLTIPRIAIPDPPDELGTIRTPRRAVVAPPAAVEADARRPIWMWIAALTSLACVLIVVGIVAFSGGGSDDRPTDESVAAEDPGEFPAAEIIEVAAATGLTTTREGTTVHIAWAPATEADVSYLVTRTDDSADPASPGVVVDGSSFDVEDVGADEVVCVSVFAFVAGVQESPRPPPVVCDG